MPSIRPAIPSDRGTIVAFNTRLALETENKRLEPDLIRRGVQQVLADPHKGRYWLAEQDERVVGQIMLTYEWSDWRCGWFWWIQSVYVHPDYRGRGVYRALFEQVKAEAESRDDVCGLRLYVDRGNSTAIEVYERSGLACSAYQMRELDFRTPPPGAAATGAPVA